MQYKQNLQQISHEKLLGLPTTLVKLNCAT